ncbi:hypothetical protein RB195_015912 [Necator americanus]|uniref:Uncharacterized protein n=1 Tax=Necator americanus TaxID=51031 RepID=A0ABR1E6Q1_NECAM
MRWKACRIELSLVIIVANNHLLVECLKCLSGYEGGETKVTEHDDFSQKWIQSPVRNQTLFRCVKEHIEKRDGENTDQAPDLNRENSGYSQRPIDYEPHDRTQSDMEVSGGQIAVGLEFVRIGKEIEHWTGGQVNLKGEEDIQMSALVCPTSRFLGLEERVEHIPIHRPYPLNSQQCHDNATPTSLFAEIAGWVVFWERWENTPHPNKTEYDCVKEYLRSIVSHLSSQSRRTTHIKRTISTRPPNTQSLQTPFQNRESTTSRRIGVTSRKSLSPLPVKLLAYGVLIAAAAVLLCLLLPVLIACVLIKARPNVGREENAKFAPTYAGAYRPHRKAAKSIMLDASQMRTTRDNTKALKSTMSNERTQLSTALEAPKSSIQNPLQNRYKPATNPTLIPSRGIRGRSKSMINKSLWTKSKEGNKNMEVTKVKTTSKEGSKNMKVGKVKTTLKDGSRSMEDRKKKTTSKGGSKSREEWKMKTITKKGTDDEKTTSKEGSIENRKVKTTSKEGGRRVNKRMKTISKERRRSSDSSTSTSSVSEKIILTKQKEKVQAKQKTGQNNNNKKKLTKKFILGRRTNSPMPV